MERKSREVNNPYTCQICGGRYPANWDHSQITDFAALTERVYQQTQLINKLAGALGRAAALVSNEYCSHASETGCGSSVEHCWSKEFHAVLDEIRQDSTNVAGVRCNPGVNDARPASVPAASLAVQVAEDDDPEPSTYPLKSDHRKV